MLTTCRMIRDAEHFSTKMSKIEGSGDLGEYIINLVKSKALPEKEVPPAPAEPVEEEKDEPQSEVMFDAVDPITPAEPPTSTSPAPEEEEKKTEPAPKTDTSAMATTVATTDPPLPPTPEQLEAEEARKKSDSGDSSRSIASEEAKLDSIEEANEAMGKELPPTPMEVDGKDKTAM